MIKINLYIELFGKLFCCHEAFPVNVRQVFLLEVFHQGFKAEAPVVSEFLNLLRISEFFGFQWQNLSEILSLFLGAILGNFWPILGHLGPFRVTFWPSWVILGLDVALGHSRRVFFFFFCRKCRIYAFFLSRMS